MFSVEKISQCPRTGITDYEIKWDIGSGMETDKGAFMSLQDAENYINRSKLGYIHIMFERYVNHARILFETGDSDYYRKAVKMEALERCIRYNQWLQGKDLSTICKVILQLEEPMKQILPKPSNPSYSSSETSIVDMMIFCKSELNIQPRNKTPQFK